MCEDRLYKSDNEIESDDNDDSGYNVTVSDDN